MSGQPPADLLAIEQGICQVGTERLYLRVPGELPAGQEFCNRNVEGHGHVRVGADHDAYLGEGGPPLFSWPVDVPAAVHAHVRVKHEISTEGHQEVLAARGHRFDDAPGDWPVIIDACKRGVDALE